MIASGLGSLLILVIGATSYYSGRSFVAMTNYADLEIRSRGALDLMTREIRQANCLTSFSTNSLTFQDFDNQPLTYSYDAGTRVLTRSKGSATTPLLTECDTLSFSVFQRNPTNDFNVVSTTNSTLVKLVQLNWKCSRTILKSKINTESVQSAKIVIRKQ
jgi:Tfp pilus assembly protein PilW